METLKINKGEGIIGVILSLIIGAVFMVYIFSQLYPITVADTGLPAATTVANDKILRTGITSAGIIALAAMVVVIGYIMKAV